MVIIMKLGVLILLDNKNIDEKFKGVHDLGFESCQLCGWDMSLFTDEVADAVTAACEKYNVKISTFWCGWGGPQVWDFYEGPLTLGLVPVDF